MISESWTEVDAGDYYDVHGYINGREAGKAWVRERTLRLHSRPRPTQAPPFRRVATPLPGLLHQPGLHRKGRFQGSQR